MFKTVLTSTIGTAGAAAAMWWGLNRVYRVNGVGWLERLGFPFDNIWLIGVSGAVVGFIYGVVRHRRNQALAAEAAEVSEENDFEFESLSEDFELPRMPLFQNLSSVANRMTTRKDGLRVEVFDLTTVVKSDESTSVTQRTVVLLPAPGLARFRLNAKGARHRFLEWIGVRGVTFDPEATKTDSDREAVEAFGRAFQLTTVDMVELASGSPEVFADGDTAARNAFPLPVLRTMARKPGWSIESHEGHLAFWQGDTVHAPRKRLAMIETALQIRKVLLQPAAPADILPAIPGTDRGLQSGRMQGALLGGVIGAFAMFFVGGITTMVLFHRRPIGQGFPAEILIFPVMLLLGAVLGVLIGTRLPIRGPLLKKPKDPKFEKKVGCAVLFGLFAGFFGGAISGAVLGEVIGLGMDDHETRIILFFGSAGIGLFTGPIVCGIAAHRFLTWWRRGREASRE